MQAKMAEFSVLTSEVSEEEIRCLRTQLATEHRLRIEERAGRTRAEAKLRTILAYNDASQPNTNTTFLMRSIGVCETAFSDRRGTPRQGCLAYESLARLVLNSSVQAQDSLAGLEDFSHVWLIFAFHQNTNRAKLQQKLDSPDIHLQQHINSSSGGGKADEFRNQSWKVAPPRLNGLRVGVFSTRTPHRPNPIGLSLVEIVSIHAAESPPYILLRGVDLVNQTPILDIKPYVPLYDRPFTEPRFASWISQEPAFSRVLVTYAAWVELQQHSSNLQHYASALDCISALREILQHDIRSLHQRRLNNLSHTQSSSDSNTLPPSVVPTVLNVGSMADSDVFDPMNTVLGQKRVSILVSDNNTGADGSSFGDINLGQLTSTERNTAAKDFRRQRWAKLKPVESHSSTTQNAIETTMATKSDNSFSDLEAFIYENVCGKTLDPETLICTYLMRLEHLTVFYVLEDDQPVVYRIAESIA